MPCYSQGYTRQTILDPNKDRDDRLQKLQEGLSSGSVRLTMRAGQPSFNGWDRGDWCDGCAYRALTALGSPELRLALARAQTGAQAQGNAR